MLLFIALLSANLRSGHPANLLLVATEFMSVFFVLIRRRALSVSTHAVDWGLALGGTMLPLMVRPGGEPLVIDAVSATLMSAGALVALAAKLSLNRRFGLAPANRGVQRAWAYSIVRHPMYAGYIVVQFGFILANPTPRNLAIYAIAWSVQVARIVREERWLMSDPDYQAYAATVRFRLVPGVF